MAEYQGSFPYLTASCFSLITMNLIVFPVDFAWRHLFKEFASLPKHIQRHDTNIIMRVILGPIIGIVFVFITVQTLRDVNWWFDNRTFITYWVVIFLMLDLFDLSQKRRFEWHPYVHHIMQTAYSLYFLEWGPSNEYNRAFPNLGLILFSLSHKPMFLLFPLRRVADKGDKKVSDYAKFAFADVIFGIVVGLGVMLILIIKHREYLPLSAMIMQPIFFLLFNTTDLPFYTFIYKIAYGGASKANKAGEKEDIEQAGATRTSQMRSMIAERISELGALLDNPKNSLLGMPFFDDEASGEDGEGTLIRIPGKTDYFGNPVGAMRESEIDEEITGHEDGEREA